MKISNWNKGLYAAHFGFDLKMKHSKSYWDGFSYGVSIISRHANCQPPGPSVAEICSERREFTAGEIAAKKS